MLRLCRHLICFPATAVNVSKSLPKSKRRPRLRLSGGQPRDAVAPTGYALWEDASLFVVLASNITGELPQAPVAERGKSRSRLQNAEGVPCPLEIPGHYPCNGTSVGRRTGRRSLRCFAWCYGVARLWSRHRTPTT